MNSRQGGVPAGTPGTGGRARAAAITRPDQVVSTYARWAPVYDMVFASVMRTGREAAASAASRAAGPGGLVLDVGVGTGLELPLFSDDTRLVGIDLSEPMLRRARDRAARDALDRVEGLVVMDAGRLAFPDGCFDAAVVPFVLSVVPEPRRVLDEVRRVVRAGGEIVLVNHFGAERGTMAVLEAWLGRHSASLGWHPQFPFGMLADWVAAARDVRLVERRSVGPFALFTLVRLGLGH